MLDGPPVPTYADIVSAARQIAGIAHRTPVATSHTVNARTGAEVFFKCENLQRAGAFKFRGAYNALSRLSADERRRGVVTFSSGNHAQAIALAGQLLDIPRVIVMPADAPGSSGRRHWGTAARSCSTIAIAKIASHRPATGRRARPHTHPAVTITRDVIAGQGTAARELFEDVGPLDVLLVPCGGGGLLARLGARSRGARPRPAASSASSLRLATTRRDRFGRRAARPLKPTDGGRRRADAVARLADLPARAAIMSAT